MSMNFVLVKSFQVPTIVGLLKFIIRTSKRHCFKIKDDCKYHAQMSSELPYQGKNRNQKSQEKEIDTFLLKYCFLQPSFVFV